MAIDTAEKRRSAFNNFQLRTACPGVTPDVAKDAEWRKEAGWGYSGIAAAAPAVAALTGRPLLMAGAILVKLLFK